MKSDIIIFENCKEVMFVVNYKKNSSRSLGCFMVFNTTFNNISVISWRSVLLMEETGVPGENHRPTASH